MENIFKKSLLLLALVLCLTGCGSSEEANENNGSNNENNKKQEKKVEYSESQKMIMKISDLISEGLAYDTGDYIMGDVKPGDYAFIKFDGSGSYYSEEDASGDIIDNENFSSFGYVKVHGTGNLETRGVLVNVAAFEKLGVTSAKEIYEILNEKENYNQAGYYKVGTDIEAGSYVVESIGGSGYFAVMSGPVGDSDIVDNDNFNGRKAVTVYDGQYLEVSRSTLTKQ